VKIAQVLASKSGGVATIPPSATIADLVDALGHHHIGAMVVSPDGRAVSGIVSERDVVRALRMDPDVLSRPVHSIMTSEVHTAEPDGTVDELMALMTERRFRHVPVLEDGVLIGIVSIGDVVKVRLGELEDERAALMDYITKGG
jgi:CBS domain-containing protein